MSTDNINNMNFKQLRSEVQLLRDELAMMKRKYEDIIYNLDDDNFSSRILEEKNNMKTAIEVTAKGIKTRVSKEDLDKSLNNYSTISQTAEQISLAVVSVNKSTDEKLKNYSTVDTTAEQITATVTKEVESALDDADYVTTAELELTADGIYSTVSETYATKSSVTSEISQTADEISTRVEKVEKGKFGADASGNPYTLFTQDADKFYFDGKQAIFTGCIWLTNNAKEQRFSISHDESNPATPFIQLYNQNDPLIIGRNTSSVYIGNNNSDNNLVATRGWVLDNAGSGGSGTVVAVFG